MITLEHQRLIRRWYYAKQQGFDMIIPDTPDYDAVRERIAVIEAGLSAVHE